MGTCHQTCSTSFALKCRILLYPLDPTSCGTTGADSDKQKAGEPITKKAYHPQQPARSAKGAGRTGPLALGAVEETEIVMEPVKEGGLGDVLGSALLKRTVFSIQVSAVRTCICRPAGRQATIVIPGQCRAHMLLQVSSSAATVSQWHPELQWSDFA